jgi:S1-C subfamily serine protease
MMTLFFAVLLLPELGRGEEPASSTVTQAVDAAKQDAEMIKVVQESVVDVQTTGHFRLQAWHNPFFLTLFVLDYFEKDEPSKQPLFFRSEGSGVIIDATGLVLTNEHIISMFDRIQVRTQDGKLFPATLVGKSVKNDVALLRIEGQGSFKAIEMADSTQAKVTDTVFAVGNPYSYSHTVSKGIISALKRQIQFDDGKGFDNLIQTDAPVTHGSSGGPLVNTQGQMLGMVTLGDRRSLNLNFAIPTEVIQSLLPILKNPASDSAKLKDFIQRFGFALQAVKNEAGEDALVVSDVNQDSQAWRSGLRARDILLGFGNANPVGLEQLWDESQKVKSGQTVMVQIQRNKNYFFTYVGAK